jgi:hypothetical protein
MPSTWFAWGRTPTRARAGHFVQIRPSLPGKNAPSKRKCKLAEAHGSEVAFENRGAPQASRSGLIDAAEAARNPWALSSALIAPPVSACQSSKMARLSRFGCHRMTTPEGLSSKLGEMVTRTYSLDEINDGYVDTPARRLRANPRVVQNAKSSNGPKHSHHSPSWGAHAPVPRPLCSMNCRVSPSVVCGAVKIQWTSSVLPSRRVSSALVSSRSSTSYAIWPMTARLS